MAGGTAMAEMDAPKEIIKEGLSEYFIYTIEGHRNRPDGWAKRLRSFEAVQGADDRAIPLPAPRVRRATDAALSAAQ
jgi:hypothetical protein